MGSVYEELSFTDEENETQRYNLISPSNKGIRTHHLFVPTTQAQHRQTVVLCIQARLGQLTGKR